MVIAWIGYCLFVSAMLGVAAFASERALGHFRKPVRWAWFAAIAGSAAAPVVAFLAPGLFPSITPTPLPPPAELGGLGAVAAASGAPEAVAAAQPVVGLNVGVLSAFLGWAWPMLALAMGFHLARACRRLRSEMRTWTPSQLHGSPIMISEDCGPAVVGVRGSIVVMPRWISQLEDRLLRLAFLHEREHQRAGDHRLFAAGIGALVFMPWNLFLWWQVSRLRLAIEFDCDRRVLARGESKRDYADALLAVSSRVSAPLLVAAAFAERKPPVERRLRRMTEPLARLRVTRTLGASSVAVLAIILVLGAPRPETAMDAADVAADALTTPFETIEWTPPPVSGAEEIEVASRPVFIPFDTGPILRNGPEVQRMFQAVYEGLKSSGVSDRIELWVYIDETGVVRNKLVKTTAGHETLDTAVLMIADAMRYQPAMNRDQPTAVWVSQWITFQAELASAEMPSSDTSQSGATDDVIPFGTDPVLQNQGRDSGGG